MASRHIQHGLLAFALLMAPAALASAQLDFAPPVNYPTDINANWVVAADFNRDGIPDVAIGYSYNTAVTVQLGNGDGTFGPAANYSVPGGPINLAVGDFDDDGYLDIATANYFWQSVSILLNRGDGTFTLGATYNTPGTCRTVRAADLNNDGKLDLLTGNLSTNSISVLLGRGDGTFQTPSSFSLSGPLVATTTVADLDGDGNQDVVVTHYNYSDTSIRVLMGHGDGTFGPASTLPIRPGHGSTNFASVADLNGDGHPDIAVNVYDPDCIEPAYIVIFFGNSQGGFSAPLLISVPAQVSGTAIGDLDGDGHPDVVACYMGTYPDYQPNRFVCVVRGHGDGTFDPPVTFPTAVYPIAVVISDLNGDGRPDLVTANGQPGTFSVLMNQTGIGPALSSVDPSHVQAGSTDQTIRLTGQRFTLFSQVRWDVGGTQTNLATTFVTETELTAVIPQTLLRAPVTAQIAVVDTQYGYRSASVPFAVENAIPGISSVNPSRVVAGGPGFVLTVNGANFNGASVVRWKGANRPTTFASSAQLTASISAADIATTSTATVTVVNLGQGGGTSNSVSVRVAPLLGGVKLTPTSLVGGGFSLGIVTLNLPAPAGGVAVGLASSNPGVALVPASVEIEEGETAAAFIVATAPVESPSPVTISASLQGTTRSAILTVKPVALSTLTLGPGTVTGGNFSTGTVKLNAPAPASGAVVTLVSSNAAASVPASITIPAGEIDGTFAVSSSPVATITSAVISSTYGGVTKSANLTVTPPKLSSVSVSPTRVVGGSQTSTGTVTLTAPAPAGGMTVALSSSVPAAQTPASVLVLEGATSATFVITTSAVAANTNASIIATLAATSRSTTLTITR